MNTNFRIFVLKRAQSIGVWLTLEHWTVLEALETAYTQGVASKAMLLRKMASAIGEKASCFKLRELFPYGPLSEACFLLGVKPPLGCKDNGFGTLV